MLDRVGRDDDVADVHAVVERTCHPCVDDLRAAEVVDERVRADSGVYLAHPAFHDDDFLFPECALAEIHARNRNRSLRACRRFQRVDFCVHGAYDADDLVCARWSASRLLAARRWLPACGAPHQACQYEHAYQN